MEEDGMLCFVRVSVLLFLFCLHGYAADPVPIQIPETFTHPRLLHTQADLQRMRERVEHQQEPWYGGYLTLASHPQSSADWRIRGGFANVSRDARDNTHNTELWQDSNTAYQNALLWAITHEKKHARKAIDILNAWSYPLREITGHDRHLAAGLYGFKLVNAAEILRYTNSGWQRNDIEQCQTMFLNVFYPVIQNFAPFANGNWDAACIKTILAIGVFCDDVQLVEQAVRYYHHGEGNGRLTHYVINDTGQCQESGRDQQHTQLGLALLAEACEIAWNQGMDLYGAHNNRLLQGFEYTAKYNLGMEVPFVPHTDITGKYKHQNIAEKGRGRLRQIYEMPYNHYVFRKKLKAPYLKQAIEKIRPEGAAFQADHPGFGTLLFFE
jgi:hypothetical protein